MQESFKKMLSGYHQFREKYALGDHSVMRTLSHYGQKPKIMIVSCCDSRVDPALILQCDPGDLFVVRNVANIVPPYEIDDSHHGTSAALEFATRFLGVRHLVLFGHSQCGGIQALINNTAEKNDFISNWVSLVQAANNDTHVCDQVAKEALHISYQHCMTFPWIKSAIEEGELIIHRWFFDIEQGKIFAYAPEQNEYLPLEIELK